MIQVFFEVSSNLRLLAECVQVDNQVRQDLTAAFQLFTSIHIHTLLLKERWGSGGETEVWWIDIYLFNESFGCNFWRGAWFWLWHLKWNKDMECAIDTGVSLWLWSILNLLWTLYCVLHFRSQKCQRCAFVSEVWNKMSKWSVMTSLLQGISLHIANLDMVPLRFCYLSPAKLRHATKFASWGLFTSVTASTLPLPTDYSKDTSVPRRVQDCDMQQKMIQEGYAHVSTYTSILVKIVKCNKRRTLTKNCKIHLDNII